MSLAARYKTVQVETASPPRLMMMLFDGALRNMQKGREAIESRNHTGAIDALERASNILLELDSTMKKDAAPELCEQLHDLYQFVIGRLLAASTRLDREALDHGERVLRPIVEAFREAVQKTATPGAATP